MSSSRQLTRAAPAQAAPPGMRATTFLTLTALLPAALLATLVGLVVTGATVAVLLADPGPLTRWGLPLATVARDLGAALTIGLLVLATYALPPAGGAGPEEGVRRRPLRPDPHAPIAGATLTAVRGAALAGAAWVLASIVVAVLSYASVAGVPPTAAGFWTQLFAFLPQLGLLRELLISAGLAAAATLGAATATRHTTLGWLTGVALLALAPLALTGHAAGLRGHELAVDSLALHLVGVTVWMGGLAALALLRGRLGEQLGSVVRRYSTLALWSFAVVAGSGLVNAGVRLGSFGSLASRYGALVVAKGVVLVLLGLAGWRHRGRLIERLDDGRPGAFWRLVTAELVLMGAATGLGAALSASAPPVPDRPDALASLAQSITGYPMPPALTAARWLTTWRLDLLWALVALVLAGAYLAGAWRLWRRGDGWPVLRTISWLVGCGVLVWVTSGAPGVYGRVLFSAHMLAHMTLTMIVPPLLVLGAPVTLALRTLNGRRDGSRGLREWLLIVVHSRFLTLLSHPIVAAALFAVSLVVFYYSPLFELSLRTHTGHVLMHVHFLLTGYLFSSVLIGVDPGPARPPYPLRLLVLFATMAFHAFFGVALLQGSALLAPDVLTALGRTWGRTPLDDQRFGGGIVWGIGELPTLLLGMGVAWAWARSDDRETRRSDRAADRDGDAELAAYNARLAALAQRGTT